jgi:hypothetical protein
MEIQLGRVRLNITVSRAPDKHKGWEQMVAVGMDDLELARLNQANTRDPVNAPWEGLARLMDPHRGWQL